MKYITFFIPIFIFYISSVLAHVIESVPSDNEDEIVSTTSTINNNLPFITPSPKAIVQDQTLQELQKILDELDTLQFGMAPHQDKKQQSFSLNELQATVPKQHQQRINQQDKKQDQQEQRKPLDLFSSLPRPPLSSRFQPHQALSGIETFKLLQEQLNLISRLMNLLFTFLFSVFFLFIFFVLLTFYLLVKITRLGINHLV